MNSSFDQLGLKYLSKDYNSRQYQSLNQIQDRRLVEISQVKDLRPIHKINKLQSVNHYTDQNIERRLFGMSNLKSQNKRTKSIDRVVLE